MHPKSLATLGQRRKEKTEFARYIGQHVRRVRLQKQITQEELAFKSGYSTSFIAKIETGHYSPSFHAIWRIAYAMELKISVFLKDFETNQ